VWADHTGRFLSHVSRYDKSAHHLLCRFGHDATPRTTIQSARDKALCLDVLAGRVRYAAFDRGSSLQNTGCYESGGPSCAHPLGSALIDIDNDGRRDMVAQMEVTFGGGAGCDFTFLAMEDRKTGALHKSPTNKALMEATRKWGVCSRAVSVPFRYQGAWYIENKYHETNVFDFHNVIRLNGARTEDICWFSVTKEPFIIE
jgi:hypothetical protein